MKFRPLHDRVVVKRIDAEDKTAGGIIIPDTAKEKPSEGEIISVGPGGRDDKGNLVPIDLKTGDRVVTNAGIHGLISNVKETTVIVKVADNVKIEMEKSAVANVLKEG